MTLIKNLIIIAITITLTKLLPNVAYFVNCGIIMLLLFIIAIIIYCTIFKGNTK